MSLVAHFSFNESISDSFGDIVTNETGVSYVDGVVSKAAAMDTGVINIPLKLGLTYSLAFWIRPRQAFNGSWRKFFECNGPNTDRSPGFWFNKNESTLHLRQLIGGVDEGFDTVDTYVVGEWYHIVFTCEANVDNTTTLRSWVNGVLDNSETYNGLPDHDDSHITLLAEKYDINDLRIYDHAIDANTVVEIARGPTLHYDMNAMQEPTINMVSTGDLNSYAPYHNVEWIGRQVKMTSVSNNTYLTLSVLGLDKAGKTLAVSGYMKRNGVPWYPNTTSRISTYESNALFYGTYFDPVTGYFESIQGYNGNGWIYHVNMDTQVGDIITIDEFQVEVKDHVTPYVRESRGGTVIDKSGHGRHATLTLSDTPTWTEESRVGRGAYTFDGNPQHIEIPTDAIPIGPQVSVCFWTFGDDRLPNYNSVLQAIDANGDRTISIHLARNNGYLYFDAGVPYDRLSKLMTPEEMKGRWHHWAFTKNAQTGDMKVYLNGDVWASRTGATVPLPKTDLVKIASSVVSNIEFYLGKLDDFRIYARELTLQDVQRIHRRVGGVGQRGDLHTHLLREIGGA